MLRLAITAVALLILSANALAIDPPFPANPGNDEHAAIRDSAALAQGTADGQLSPDAEAAPDHGHADDAHADDAHGEAAHGDGHGDAPPLLNLDLGSAVWNLLIFLTLVIILGKFVWPKILEGLQSREQKIHDDLTGAEKANAEAKKTLAEYEKRVAEAQAEARQMLDQARLDAEQLKARLADETEQEMARLRERATEDINRAKQQALQDLSAHAADLAVDVAGRILQRDIEPGDTDRLIQQSLEELDKAQARPN